jgi:hypothetical protein
MVWDAKPDFTSIQTAIQQTVLHADYRDGMPILCEAQHSDYNPPIREVRAIALELAKVREKLGPIALVVHSALHFGLGNMLHAYCNMHGVRLAVFYEQQKGLDWALREATTPGTRYLKAGA